MTKLEKCILLLLLLLWLLEPQPCMGSEQGVLGAAGVAKQAANFLAKVDNIFGDLTSVLTVIFM
jgi:hypothetical protein